MKRPSFGRTRQQARKRVKATAAKPEPLSRHNLPTGLEMSINSLCELTGLSRKTARERVRQGFYPSIRTERGAFRVLVEPTLEILFGRAPPGPPSHCPDDSAAKERQPKRLARGKSVSKSKSVSRKGQATAVVP
jgi:hypothetical protein